MRGGDVMRHKSLKSLQSIEKWLPLLMLPLIVAVCFTLWQNMSSAPYTVMYSDTGVWDLRGFDFAHGSASVRGQVEFIPGALLTPGEFAARENEISLGNPQDVCQYATSRIRILLPEGKTYMLAGRSTDYAERIFVNGQHVADVGTPGASGETMVPNTADLNFMCEPKDGVIEIVQQVSNFVHREGGWHDYIRVGYPDAVRAAYRHDFAVLIMGCFLALFIVHMTLFVQLRSYRANLYFSLFCLTWFLRSGVTGAKVFSALLPQLSWYIKFRIEYLSLPVSGLLVILLLHALFPRLLPTWFRYAVYTISSAFIGLFLFADTVLMSWAMLGCYAYLSASILFVAVLLCLRIRRPDLPQSITLAGLAIFFYAGIRDMFYHSDILLPPNLPATFSEIAMLIFVFFEMTAMFIGTARATEEAKAIEQRLNAENAMLDRMNRLKSDLMATVSHETRTPLAVLSGYAELIAMGMRKKGVDEQTAADLDRIADETQRIAKIMAEMQDLSRNRDSAAHRTEVQMADILRQTARLYEPILARKNVTLTVDAPEDLPPVYANPDELTQVLFNLLQNARNHTENGSVEVNAQCTMHNAQLEVTVRDTGAGISPEFLPRVFDRHAHAHPEGMGLGLPICKEIIDGLGGRIRVESELGKGTTVSFTLPVWKGGEPYGEQDGLIG